MPPERLAMRASALLPRLAKSSRAGMRARISWSARPK